MNARRINFSFAISQKNLFALIVLMAIGWIWLLWGFTTKRVEFRENPPADPQRIQAARQLIDPNNDQAGSLVRLDGVARNMAQNIIDYRSVKATSTQPAFEKLSDMKNIKGIGPMTIIRFEGKTTLPEK